MVNTGKPSQGCYMCRARRIKCDEAKPNCNRCQKSKRICPGYREINPRDENKLVKRKASRSLEELDTKYIVGAKSEQRPTYWTDTSTIVPSSSLGYSRHANQSCYGSRIQSLQFSPTSLIRQLSTPIDQQSTCFFISNYVNQTVAGKTTHYLDYLIPLLEAAQPKSALSLTFAAVSAAAFASRPNSKSLLPQVDQYYVKALKEINTALKDPLTAKEDATLAAVLLLSTYETIVTSRSANSSWLCHVGGAVALVAARGKEQFKTKVAIDMFKSVRAHMSIQSIARSVPMGPDVDWWMTQIEEGDVEGELHHLMLKVAQLRLDAEEIIIKAARSSKNIENVLKLLRRAESLEEEFAAWCPPEWEPKTIAYVENTELGVDESPVFPGRIDSFDNFLIASTWTMSQTSRLFIWSTVVRCIAWLGGSQDYRLTPEFTVAARACGELISDIIASVPYFLGSGDDLKALHGSTFAVGGNNDSTIKPASAIFMLWPIFTACSSDFASQSQKDYLRGRLNAIYEQTGMSQATLLVKQSVLCHPSAFIQRERHNHGLQIPQDSPKIQCVVDVLAFLNSQASSKPIEHTSPTESFSTTTSRSSMSPHDTVPALAAQVSTTFTPSITPYSTIETYPSASRLHSSSSCQSLSLRFTMDGLSMSSPPEELAVFDPSLRWMQDWDVDEGTYVTPRSADLEATSDQFQTMDTTAYINYAYEDTSHAYDFSKSFLLV